MGLVINPTAFRIGYVKAWTDAWYLHRIHYSVFIHKSLEIKILLQYILLKCYPSHWSRWIYSHTTFYYSNNKFQISLFIYDGNDPYQYYRSARQHKYGWYKKSKFYRYWTKKQLLDLKFFYQRWFLLCQAMNFDFEDLKLDNLRWRVNKRHIRKMAGLRKKYGKLWVAREDLFIWRYVISSTSEESFNKMGIDVLNKLFKIYILPKIRKSFKSKDYSRIYLAMNVLRSHKMFYFFFSYINKILKYIPTYPIGLFNKLTYKLCYRFFRMYFIFKPYWINLSKLYELILLYINVNSKFKIYILDNSHLNASYLARYIITCLRYKFNYRDTMIPIKKTLLKVMMAKRWRSVKDFKKTNWRIYLKRYKYLLKDRIYFHLINNDIWKMFLYRLNLLKKFKHMLKKPIYIFKKFTLFDFKKLKKMILFIKDNKKNNIKLYIKNLKISYFYKSKINIFKFLEVLNFNYWKKIKINFNFKFFKKLKKRKKFLIRRFKFRKNIYISMKKRYILLLNVFFIQKKRWIILKKIFFSLFYFYKRITNCYSFIKINLFNNKLDKFIFKTYFWMKRKLFIRNRWNRWFMRRFKRRFRIEADFEDFLIKRKVNWWIKVRKVFKNRNKKRIFMNLSLNLKYIFLKTISLKEIKLKFLNFKKFKKIKIIFFNFYKNYINSYLYVLKNELKIFIYINKIIKFFFYNKSFFYKHINMFIKKRFIRNYTNLFFFHYLNNYSKRFKTFIFNINLYQKYIKNVLNLKEINSQFLFKEPKKYNLEEMPLKDKFKRLRTLESGSRSLLYGYKFHFVGRFTRKQKAASLWFAKGANSVSSMRVDVDYGFYTIALRYSACTLKVWLYKNKGYSYKYGYRLV